MEDKNRVISDKREVVPSPKNLVEDGIANMGTFDAPIENLNIKDCADPLGKRFPDIFKGARIKEWDAFEINFKEGFLVGAIYSIGVAMTNAMFFYDKRTKQMKSNQVFGRFDKNAIQSTLVNGHNYYKSGRLSIDKHNNFEKGECSVVAISEAYKNYTFMEAKIKMHSVSKPSVVVMPLGDNRPLYTQKELFKAEGTIQIGDELFTLDEEAYAVVDDHKAYYPFNMHYDWLTGFGLLNGKEIGFNLTKNQVINPVDYNENFIWYDGNIYPLPTIDFDKEDGIWHVHDKNGYVDVYFNIENSYQVKKSAGLLKIDYSAPFGDLKGTIKYLDKTVDITGLTGFGEDKTYRL